MSDVVRCLACGILFAGLSAGCGYKLDHFKVWDVEAEPAERLVKVKGQFDKEPKETRVEKLVAFGNPVVKNGRPIFDKNSHLTWYSISRPEPKRAVRIRNQFGYQNWSLGDAQRLLLPAEKKEPELFFPTRLEHFVCYAVESEGSLVTTVSLSDAFDKMRHVTEQVRLHPAFFCVPVDKNDERMRNRKSHLAVYFIKPETLLEPPIGPIHVDDQFGNHKLTVRKSMYLAVPSKKLTVRGPR